MLWISSVDILFRSMYAPCMTPSKQGDIMGSVDKTLSESVLERSCASTDRMLSCVAIE